MPTVNPNNPYQNYGGTTFNESRGFQTVDLYSDPQDQSGNFLLQADNLLNHAGILFARPGKQGQWGGALPSSSSSSSLSSSSSGISSIGGTYTIPPTTPLYKLCDFWDANGSPWLLQTSNGKIYKTQVGSNYYTEILDATGSSFNIVSSSASAARMG